MSFFNKLIEQNFEEISLQESIENQIKILLSNKVDRYWTYDSNKKKLEGVHIVFEKEYLSNEFLFELSKIIPIVENRLYDVICKLSYDGMIPKLEIDGKLKKNNQNINTISINVQDI